MGSNRAAAAEAWCSDEILASESKTSKIGVENIQGRNVTWTFMSRISHGSSCWSHYYKMISGYSLMNYRFLDIIKNWDIYIYNDGPFQNMFFFLNSINDAIRNKFCGLWAEILQVLKGSDGRIKSFIALHCVTLVLRTHIIKKLKWWAKLGAEKHRLTEVHACNHLYNRTHYTYN